MHIWRIGALCLSMKQIYIYILYVCGYLSVYIHTNNNFFSLYCKCFAVFLGVTCVSSLYPPIAYHIIQTIKYGVMYHLVVLSIWTHTVNAWANRESQTVIEADIYRSAKRLYWWKLGRLSHGRLHNRHDEMLYSGEKCFHHRFNFT